MWGFISKDFMTIIDKKVDELLQVFRVRFSFIPQNLTEKEKHAVVNLMFATIEEKLVPFYGFLAMRLNILVYNVETLDSIADWMNSTGKLMRNANDEAILSNEIEIQMKDLLNFFFDNIGKMKAFTFSPEEQLLKDWKTGQNELIQNNDFRSLLSSLEEINIPKVSKKLIQLTEVQQKFYEKKLFLSKEEIIGDITKDNQDTFNTTRFSICKKYLLAKKEGRDYIQNAIIKNSYKIEDVDEWLSNSPANEQNTLKF